MSEFYCSPCKLQLNSKSQWDQHIIGGKHLRASSLIQSESLQLDMSAAISLTDGKYGCKLCEEFTCSGRIPFEQHLVGQKHMRNAQRSGEQSTNKSLNFFITSVPQVVTSRIDQQPDSSSTLSDDLSTYGVLQIDGITYKCKACDGFFCSGQIPMLAHLKGKNHQKNVKRNGVQPSVLAKSLELLNVSTQPPLPLCHPRSVEKRVENAWEHKPMCGFEYPDFFPQFSIPDKINALDPHFAFISKDEPIPNLVKYLSM